MEDIVYRRDQRLLQLSPLRQPASRSPDQSLDDGGTGCYEDCVWQHYLSETYGVQIIVDLWDWRRRTPAS